MIKDETTRSRRHRPFAARRPIREVIGIVRRKRDGYGFLTRLDGQGEDLFLPPHEAQALMEGDRVRARIVPGRFGRDVAEVVEVLEHARRLLLGTYRAHRKRAWIEPLDPMLPDRIPVDVRCDIPDGAVVKARFARHLEEGGARAQVIGVAGEAGDPRLEILEIAFRRGFSDSFPPRVLAEARAVRQRVTAEDRKGREDLRDLPLVTIDGPDAKDFDDAVFVRTVPGGFRLVVAIADVSHYVREGTALDEEAFLRGTSVYFPGLVLPMLPPELSNGICSLNPGEDRLCMVVDMFFDPTGERRTAELYPAIMRSHARCTYQEVAALLRGEPTRLEPFAPHLRDAAELAARLRKRRLERGALDIDLPEARIRVGKDGRPVGIGVEERTDAHRMIEEFMLAANEAVARHFDRLGLPTIYRVHDFPDPEKLEAFARLARAAGVDVKIGEKGPSPLEISRLVRRIQASPQKRALQMLLLRAMMQAVYSAENIGHYGLASDYYLHFTSPIRRYPDLMVHRLLKQHWGRRGRIPSLRRIASITEELQAVADHSSEKERAAMEAEREADRYLKCLYMQDRIGERFDATVVGVAEFGLFAEIDELLVDGLVPVESLGHRPVFDEARQRLLFPRANRSFGIGDRIRVEVAAVDVSRRQIHFVPVREEEPVSPRKAARPKAAKPQKAVKATAAKTTKTSKRTKARKADAEFAGRRRSPVRRGRSR